MKFKELERQKEDGYALLEIDMKTSKTKSHKIVVEINHYDDGQFAGFDIVKQKGTDHGSHKEYQLFDKEYRVASQAVLEWCRKNKIECSPADVNLQEFV